MYPVYYIFLLIYLTVEVKYENYKRTSMKFYYIVTPGFFNKFRLKSSDYYVNHASGLFLNTLIQTVSYIKKIWVPAEPINIIIHFVRELKSEDVG